MKSSEYEELEEKYKRLKEKYGRLLELMVELWVSLEKIEEYVREEDE